MTEVRRIRWGYADFIPDIQEWLQTEGFVPIGLFKTTPVRSRLTNTSTVGFEFLAFYLSVQNKFGMFKVHIEKDVLTTFYLLVICS